MIERSDLQRIAISPDRGPGEVETLSLVQELEATRDRGATAFMYREKSLEDDAFLRRAETLRAACRELGLAFLLNERVAFARALEPDAVHATYRSPSLTALRSEAGWEGAVGISVHDVEEGTARAREGFEYLVFGPIFDTPSKRGLVDPVGIEALKCLVAAVAETPVVAIGGFDSTRADLAAECGAAGVAMMREFFPRPEPKGPGFA